MPTSAFKRNSLDDFLGSKLETSAILAIYTLISAPSRRGWGEQRWKAELALRTSSPPITMRDLPIIFERQGIHAS
jgi:hypothetical protein